MKTAIAALVVVSAVCAVVTGSAFAGWFIEGKELPAGSEAALASTAKVDESFTLLVPTVLDLSIVCSGSVLDSSLPEIIGFNAVSAKSLGFLACNTTKPASGCALETTNQTITTMAINATAKEATLPDVKLIVSARTKNTLAEIAFNEANTCAFNGEEPVKGLLTLNAPTLQEEQASQLVEGQGSVENNSLEVANSKAFLEKGQALLNLASGQNFDFREFFSYAQPAKLKEVENKLSANQKITLTATRALEIKILEITGGENAFTRLKEKLGANTTCINIKMNKGDNCEVEYDFAPKAKVPYIANFKIKILAGTKEYTISMPIIEGEGT